MGITQSRNYKNTHKRFLCWIAGKKPILQQREDIGERMDLTEPLLFQCTNPIYTNITLNRKG
jgi:hypothetical protein